MNLARTVVSVALALVLAPSVASAAVWGGFDSSRVNYSGGILYDGSSHSTFRARLTLQGHTVATSTGTLTSAYLSGVDVFYTSLSSQSASPLSSSEQTAIAAFVASGGTFIISGDIFNLALYNSEGAPFGISNFTASASNTATSSGTSHPVMAGVTTVGGTSHVSWTSGPNNLIVAAGASPFLDVYDASTGFSGGRLLVVGDHNIFTDGFINSMDNLTLLDNIITWASGPANVAPTADASGPYTGTKNNAIILNGTQSTDSDGTVTLWQWDCENDGVIDMSVLSGSGSTCTYPAVGTYTVSLTVTDSGGATDTDTATVTVGNDAPTATAGGPYSGDEGVAITLSGSGSTDPGGALVSYAWDCDTDGVTDVTDTVPTADCTYGNQGSFTATLTVTDDDGATNSATATVNVVNVAPVVTSISVPSGDEGASLTFTAVATDVAADSVTYSWDFGDGTTGTGASATHAYTDDGTYTITVTVADLDGGSANQTASITIANVDPFILGAPATTATQGATYAYAPTVSDPGDEVFTWTLGASASPNVTFDGTTGGISWIPTSADVAQGTFAMELTVSDGDGGADSQTWSVLVSPADTDGDGLSDDWETDNGLNPNDPSDATGDPDGDGLTNLDEFVGGTDPFVYDGPSTPVAVSPLTGDEVAVSSPDLVIVNSTDPQNDVLVYTLEVYSDSALTTLVASDATVTEDASGQTTWTVDVALTENVEYWWRAAASDPFVTGAFSGAESFVVNVTEEAPSVPVLVFPVGDEIAASLTPTLSWTESVDPEGGALSYVVEVSDANGALVTSTSAATGDGTSAEWTVDVSLAEDGYYEWTAKGVDEAGLESAFADPEGFWVSEGNGAPSEVVFVEPVDGSGIASLSPILVVTEGIDPEGTEVSHFIEVDPLPSFDSADYMSETFAGTGTGQVAWDLDAAGVVLPENQWVYARVQGSDEDGVSTVPDVISFFMRGQNEPPEVPTLVSPDDGTLGAARPLLVAEDVLDPEQDVVRLEFVVARDAALTDVIATSDPMATGTGEVTWTVNVDLSGDVFWSARSLDDSDAASDWAAPWSYSAEAQGDDDDASGDDDDAVGGCDCQASISGGETPGLSLLLLLVPLMRRRRAR